MILKYIITPVIYKGSPHSQWVATHKHVRCRLCCCETFGQFLTLVEPELKNCSFLVSAAQPIRKNSTAKYKCKEYTPKVCLLGPPDIKNPKWGNPKPTINFY